MHSNYNILTTQVDKGLCPRMITNLSETTLLLQTREQNPGLSIMRAEERQCSFVSLCFMAAQGTKLSLSVKARR